MKAIENDSLLLQGQMNIAVILAVCGLALLWSTHFPF